MERKPGRPRLETVYVTTSVLHTSKGTAFHGDTIKIPKAEADNFRKKGAVK